jgi:phage recombination protein Bet
MSTEIVKSEDKTLTEYIPFGASDKIKLSVAMVQNLIAVKTRSGKTCSQNDALKFIAMCVARKLNPWEGDAFLIGYDSRDGVATFSLITAHQAFLKRAELNAEYDGMASGVIVQDDNKLLELEGDFYSKGQIVVGGWCKVFFKNRKIPMYKRIRLERFQKTFGLWLDDAPGMCVKCAEADALRSSFPTMLGGLYLKEEISNEQPAKTTTPIFSSLEPEPGIQEAEVVAERPPEPPQEAPSSPPARPEPPKAVKTPAPVKTAPEAAKKPTGVPPQNLRVKAMREKIADAGLTVEKVLDFMINLGTIESNTSSIEAVYDKHPEVFSMLEEQSEDIFNRIKEG